MSIEKSDSDLTSYSYRLETDYRLYQAPTYENDQALRRQAV